MDEYLRLLRIFNERHHLEYGGYACATFFDDGSGYFTYRDKELSWNYELDFGYGFNTFDDYKNICENR
jgi:hypothetical protein